MARTLNSVQPDVHAISQYERQQHKAELAAKEAEVVRLRAELKSLEDQFNAARVKMNEELLSTRNALADARAVEIKLRAEVHELQSRRTDQSVYGGSRSYPHDRDVLLSALIDSLSAAAQQTQRSPLDVIPHEFRAWRAAFDARAPATDVTIPAAAPTTSAPVSSTRSEVEPHSGQTFSSLRAATQQQAASQVSGISAPLPRVVSYLRGGEAPSHSATPLAQVPAASSATVCRMHTL